MVWNEDEATLLYMGEGKFKKVKDLWVKLKSQPISFLSQSIGWPNLTDYLCRIRKDWIESHYKSLICFPNSLVNCLDLI